MATITARKTSSKTNQPATTRWTCQVRYKGKALTQTFATRKDAIEWAKETETSISHGKPVSVTKHTLGGIIKYFSETELRAPRYKKNSIPKVIAKWHWWTKQLGGVNILLSDITREAISEALVGLRLGTTSPTKRKLEGQTVNHYIDALSVLLDVAHRKLFWIVDNPIKSIAKDPIGKPRSRWLKDAERASLLKAALDNPDPAAALNCWLWIRTALTTGARQAEIAQITWLDINFEKAQITLRGTADEDGYDEDVDDAGDGTKNGQTRIVPLHPEVAAALEKLKKADVVATHPFGEYPREDYRDAVRDAGLKHGKGRHGRICFHTLRHTCATVLAENAASRHQLMEYMGWKSGSMADRYVHKTGHLDPVLIGAVRSKL